MLRAGADEIALDAEGRIPADLVRCSFAGDTGNQVAADQVTRALDLRQTGFGVDATLVFEETEGLEPVGTLAKVAEIEVGGKADNVSIGGDFGCLMSRLFA